MIWTVTALDATTQPQTCHNLQAPPVAVQTLSCEQGVHNSQGELAEEIRLPAPNPMPSIAQLRHNTEAVQQQGPPPVSSIQSDSSTLPVGDQHAAGASFNATGSLSNDQQLPQLPGSTGKSTPEQQQDSSTGDAGSSSGSTVNGDSSRAADTGVASASSSRTSMSDGVLETHSRAGDGSEDSLIKSEEMESTDDDYHG